MSDKPQYNPRNPAVKRILQEIKEVQADTSGDFIAEALESDIFEWHFVIRGPPETEFEGGIYHGRILLPADYPFKPPGFMMLTPSGRFETGVKICLSISSHHPEQWQPSWSVRTALTALIAFMPSPGAGALGSLDYTKEERRKLAAKSRTEIPKFGSPDRQRIIDEMHARMLAMPPPKAPSSSKPAEAPPEAGATTPATPAAAAAAATAVAAPATEPAAATADSKQADIPAQTASTPLPSTAGAAAAPAAQVPAALPSLQPAAAAPVAESPAAPVHTAHTVEDGRQQVPASLGVAPAASPATPRQPVPGLSSPVLTQQAAAPGSTIHGSPHNRGAAGSGAQRVQRPAPAAAADTWALNVIAVALVVMIIAILLRKALAAAGVDLPVSWSS